MKMHDAFKSVPFTAFLLRNETSTVEMQSLF